MMKKTTALLLAVWILLSLCACGGASETAPAETPAEAQAEESVEEPAEPLSPLEQLKKASPAHISHWGVIISTI
ncbi:MAG: hypothetical protein IJQ02_08180 [Oscillospiraceae bacterium]|nr:hypothetical protein [Oscillospiraceae bacterium]